MDNKFFIQSSSVSRMIGVAEAHDGLYVLHDPVVPSPTIQSTSTFGFYLFSHDANIPSHTLWHLRLGHIVTP